MSTNVGGVPEVLPPDMIELCHPNVDSLVDGLSKAISRRMNGVVHERMSQMYSWNRVANETVVV